MRTTSVRFGFRLSLVVAPWRKQLVALAHRRKCQGELRLGEVLITRMSAEPWKCSLNRRRTH